MQDEDEDTKKDVNENLVGNSQKEFAITMNKKGDIVTRKVKSTDLGPGTPLVEEVKDDDTGGSQGKSSMLGPIILIGGTGLILLVMKGNNNKETRPDSTSDTSMDLDDMEEEESPFNEEEGTEHEIAMPTTNLENEDVQEIEDESITPM